MSFHKLSQDHDTRVATVGHYRPIADLIPPHWQAASIVANGIHQQYYRTGGHKPPLVLLHGFEEYSLCWLRVARALEHAYDVIMPDTRGHGRSDAATSGFSLDILAADQAALIQSLGLVRPVILGRSMGATVGVYLAATFPRLVQALLLEEPPMRPMPVPDSDTNPAFAAWYQSWLAQMQTLKTQPHKERMVTALSLLPPTDLWVEDDLVPWVEAQVHFDLETLAYPLADPELFGAWQEEVSRIVCPILLMTGNLQRGAATTSEGIGAVQAAWHNGQHVAFEQAGHLISREAFESYVATVLDFLQIQFG